MKGREFTIVELAYEPRDLEARLAELGWRAPVTLIDRVTSVVDARRSEPLPMRRRNR